MQLASPRPLSVRLKRASKTIAPVFLSTPTCPACGRQPAIVFQDFRSIKEPHVESRRVCLACCPKVAGHS